jgi:2',3'-cyclic-nucleotide 2'-phosphodiesterase (5'-nucleotidase family)
MKKTAREKNVDLLLVDAGDLHDGNGLGDLSDPSGKYTLPIFADIDYDILTIGNHELYESEIAYDTYKQFTKFYGEKYVTSNVEILNPDTQEYETLGSKYRYFTTEHGLRIMAFGILFDFTGNSNASRITKSADLVEEAWFKNAVMTKKPVDLFIVAGHNPVRNSGSTFDFVAKAMRKMRPDVPIQFFGGHAHVRDFIVYDEGSTGISPGRYCETLGWLSMSGIQSDTFNGTMKPKGLPHPTKKATSDNATYTGVKPSYARRYMDWNRLTFSFHANESQDTSFDTRKGLRITKHMTNLRKKLNLTTIFGCAPTTYCASCVPFGEEGSIFKLVQDALSLTVVNETRKDTPRLTFVNSGSIRFDLVKGPFTLDDSFVVAPFDNKFMYIPEVPYDIASKILDILNAGPPQKRKRALDEGEWSGMELGSFGLDPMKLLQTDSCVNPSIDEAHLNARSTDGSLRRGKIIRRQYTDPTPGYTTTDDFGTDGDDTIHSKIPYFPAKNDIQGKGGFPTDGSTPEKVDVVFFDFIQSYILKSLKDAGKEYTAADVALYMPEDFTGNSYLPAYAKLKWQEGVPNCPVGDGS